MTSGGERKPLNVELATGTGRVCNRSIPHCLRRTPASPNATERSRVISSVSTPSCCAASTSCSSSNSTPACVHFAGLTAYDTQRTKSLYAQVAGTGAEQHVVIMSALNLYLDFINMFLFILRLFGNRN